MGTWERKKIAGSSPPHKLPRDLLLGEIPQNTKRNKKRGFYGLHHSSMVMLMGL